jgi:hypothetical protein
MLALGQLEKAQFENIAGNPGTALAVGRVWCDITTPSAGIMKFYDGTATQQFMSTSGSFAGASSIADGSNNLLWLDDPSRIFNLGVKTSVAANAMTFTIQTKALANPSAASPVYIPFRVATSATGQYVLRAVTSALTITIPQFATLGNVQSPNPQYIYLCAIDNAGTVELALIGSRYDLDEGSVINTTILNASSLDWNTLYSTTARTGVAFKVLARIKQTQGTVGTWTSNSTEISLSNGRDWPRSSTSKNDLTFSIFGTTASGTSVFYKRIDDRMFVKGYFKQGTTNGALFSVGLPTNYNIDFQKIAGPGNGAMFGTGHQMGGASAGLFTNGFGLVCFSDLVNQSTVYLGYRDNAAFGFQKDIGTTIGTLNFGTTFNFDFPVEHWRSY